VESAAKSVAKDAKKNGNSGWEALGLSPRFFISVHVTVATRPAVYWQSEEIVFGTKQLLQDLNSGNVFLMIHGKIKYRDYWSVDHWMAYCGVIYGKAPENFTACTEYNQIDHNEPKE
jgi:hypothetical protein